MSTVKNTIRKLLFSRLSQHTIDRFYMTYYRIRYPREMRKECSYGENNKDKIFYVIRPRTDGTEGLMSLFVNVIKNLYYAKEHGYEPVVDFKNYHTQYDDNINGEGNSWNFFFTQPTRYSLDDVYSSKSVILSGLEIQWYRPDLLQQRYDDESLGKLHDFIFNYIDFNSSVKKRVDEEMSKLELNREKTLGLYLRGTDYVELKPSGHPVQPTVDQAVRVVKDYIKMYDVEKIFLVTEDGRIKEGIQKEFGKMCVTVSYDTFINNYDGKNFLSHDKSISELSESPYERGLNYLVKLIILSKCYYFVGGKTMGSWTACLFSDNRFVDKYVFELGFYGK